MNGATQHWSERHGIPILAAMSFWKDISPRRAIGDLIGVISENRGQHLLPALLAIAIPATMIGFFILDGRMKSVPPAGQKIVYVESWSADRTEEEILRDRWEIQCKKDARAKQIQGAYAALGRATGVDTAEAEAQAKAAREDRKDLPGQEYAKC